MEQHGIDVPEETKSCGHPHEVDEERRKELHIARTLGAKRVERGVMDGYADFVEETQELIEERGLPQAVDLGGLSAVGQPMRDTGLVARSG